MRTKPTLVVSASPPLLGTGFLERHLYTVGILLALILFAAREAPGQDSLTPPPSTSFRNVDEAIGWVKAKGKCNEGICSVFVRLKPRSSKGEQLSPGWQPDAVLSVFDIPGTGYSAYRRFTAAIRRHKTFALSPKDPGAILTTLKITSFDFSSDGHLAERSLQLIVRNFDGSALLDVAFPVAKYWFDPHMVEDVDILTKQLGIGWQFGGD